MMDKNNNGIGLHYRNPEAKVVFIKAQGILCVSKPEKFSTEMEEGDDNW